MFGYVIINEPEMKIKDFRIYRSFYCGVCRSLRRYGIKGWVTLNYDMTFLALLLTALYEEEGETTPCRCMLHPLKKCQETVNIYTEYAADMTILLTYYQCMDHWLDEKRIYAKAEALMLKSNIDKLAKKYPRQYSAIEKYINNLNEAEKRNEVDLDKISGLTGTMLGELFVYKTDEWADTLRQLGFYLGKFIYLMDAFEDTDRDAKKGCFNPLLKYRNNNDYIEYCETILTAMMAESAKAFERLPILMYEDILRNILYSGVWSKYQLQIAKKEKKDGSL